MIQVRIYQLVSSEQFVLGLLGRPIEDPVFQMVYQYEVNQPFIDYCGAGMYVGQLQEIFEKFNCDHPADYRGRSLSVSDVVAFSNGEKQVAFVCEPTGWSVYRPLCVGY